MTIDIEGVDDNVVIVFNPCTIKISTLFIFIHSRVVFLFLRFPAARFHHVMRPHGMDIRVNR